ncbi:phenylalanine--tRNA ligase subunit alpha [Candidatus Woesearchaeota archaeon]|nr:phenylalanine--tRNA ligase subunit alpha [Candidatus Woesearchaeota archaeon]
MEKQQDIKNIIKKLHPLERRVLPALADCNTETLLEKTTSLKQVEVVRALQWLYNKRMVNLSEKITELVELDSNGIEFLKTGLPEKRFLQALSTEKKTFSQLLKVLSKEEINMAIGLLKSKAAITVRKEEELVFSITNQGKKILEKGFMEERFLQKLPLNKNELEPEDKFCFDNLLKRKKIVKTTIRKEKIAKLLPLGEQIIKVGISSRQVIDRLTPEIIKKDHYKGKEFRAYDVEINVPKIKGGKTHPYADFVFQARQKLVEMGFTETTGPIIETEFFNFDALYQPQNHPARNWTDTYAIKQPKYGRLPDKKTVQAVKNAHENGAGTGSTGWKYKWSETIAKQLMPRAHDTAITPRELSRKDLKIPGRYFTIVRCFRPDVIDATHAVEFNQLGGFVVGDNLNFAQLLGLLKDFAQNLTGAKEFKYFPDYFPFVEPGVQLSAKHPKFGWMELCGAGIGRPELSEPLGIKGPVLMWGFGIDRLAMLKLGISDIRDLFQTNIKTLRESKAVML